MRKQLLLLISLFCISAHSQSFFVRIGKNFTKFDYQNAQNTPINLNSDIGNSYEVGCTFPIQFSDSFHYEVGLQFDEFNSYTQAPVSAVTYNLQYLGLNNSLRIALLNTDHFRDRFALDFKGGLSIYKYVAGKEEILGKIHDLQMFPEFSKVFLVANIGLHSKFMVSDDMYISLGYDRVLSFMNTGNTNLQTLSFTSNQIKVGVHFEMN